VPSVILNAAIIAGGVGGFGRHRATVALAGGQIHWGDISIKVWENGNSFADNWLSATSFLVIHALYSRNIRIKEREKIMEHTHKNDYNALLFEKVARGVTYFGYGFSLLACLFLWLGFILLLFGANYATPFVQFVYNGAATFMQPFRDIFTTHQVSQTGYFDPSALFASLIYLRWVCVRSFPT